MRSLLAIVLVLAPLWAQADVVKATINGKVRLCFTEEGAKRLLDRDKDYDVLEAQKGKLEEKLKLNVDEIDILNHQYATEKEVSELRLKQYLQEQKDREAADKRASAWYRSPFLWFGLGILSTTAVVFAATR